MKNRQVEYIKTKEKLNNCEAELNQVKLEANELKDQ